MLRSCVAFSILFLALGCSSSGSGDSGSSMGGGGGGSGTGGGGGSSSTGMQACENTCNKINSLCTAPVSECVSGCSTAYTMFSSCKTQLDATYFCTETRPLSDFHCNAEGEAQLNQGACNTEVQALAACVN